MPKLPDISDLGGIHVDGSRPIGSYDAGAIARVGAAETENIGALGKGVAKVGEGLVDYELDKGRWEYALAHDKQVLGKVDLYSETQKDKDYSTMSQRYGERIAQVNNEAANLISNPRFRERFLADTQADVAQFNSTVAAHATKLARAARGEYDVQSLDKGQDAYLAAPDEATRTRIFNTQNDKIEARFRLGDITEGEAYQQKQQAALRFATTHMKALTLTDPSEAVRRLENPAPNSVESIIPADKRLDLLIHARTQEHKVGVGERVSFDRDVSDTLAQAGTTGDPGPRVKSEGDFKRRYGAEEGPLRYQDYKDNLDLNAKLPTIANLSGDDAGRFLASLFPKEGEPGFAAKLQRFQQAQKVVSSLAEDKKKDPGEFAITRLPAVTDAYRAFEEIANDPAQDQRNKTGAADAFARTTLMEQERVGIPADRRSILPKDYAENLKRSFTTAADSDDPKARTGLIARVQQEAALWGPHWGEVMRTIAPDLQPEVRAIAAGADPIAMSRLLALPKGESPSKTLKEQSETKYSDLTRELNTAMAPLKATMLPGQVDRDFFAYYGLAEKLGALYVRDGKSAGDASSAAFKALIGDRYEFRDGTWRMPKSAGVSADDVQKGTVAARAQLTAAARNGGGLPFDIGEAVNDMGLTDNRADSLSKFARDGRFITSHDNSGLNLMYGDKFVRGSDGTPVLLSWDALAQLGKGRVKPPSVASQLPGF